MSQILTLELPDDLARRARTAAAAANRRVEDVVLDSSTPPALTARGATIALRSRIRHKGSAPWPYVPTDSDENLGEPFSAVLVPYHSWANRGPSTMRVWMPTTGLSAVRGEAKAQA